MWTILWNHGNKKMWYVVNMLRTIYIFICREAASTKISRIHLTTYFKGKLLAMFTYQKKTQKSKKTDWNVLMGMSRLENFAVIIFNIISGKIFSSK